MKQILGHVPGISGEVGLLFLPRSQALLPWAWGRTQPTSAGEGVDMGSLVLNQQGAKPEHFLPCLRGLLMLLKKKKSNNNYSGIFKIHEGCLVDSVRRVWDS